MEDPSQNKKQEGSSPLSSSPAAATEQKVVGSSLEAPFWAAIADCQRILLAGCGGGYDIFSGIPLFFALKKMGKDVSLASLAFTTGLQMVTGNKFANICVEVTADSVRQGVKDYNAKFDYYFPELLLSQWFREKEGLEVPVYTFERTGVVPLTEVYRALVDHLKLDAIVLVDGGTDSIMRGDEIGLGTPTEDMASICAVNQVDDKGLKRFLVCVGFGIDAFHGVNHAHFLENVAYHMRTGGFLGTFSLLPQHEESRKFIDAYESCQPSNSIVCASVVSAVEGQFGNYHHPATKQRTAGSKLFINPLMTIYWCFVLEKVAASVYYMPELVDTQSSSQVRNRIHQYVEDHFRNDKGKFIGRQAASIPH